MPFTVAKYIFSFFYCSAPFQDCCRNLCFFFLIFFYFKILTNFNNMTIAILIIKQVLLILQHVKVLKLGGSFSIIVES